jgi:hypothetical protein
MDARWHQILSCILSRAVHRIGLGRARLSTERATLMVMDVRASSSDPGAISGDDG